MNAQMIEIHLGGRTLAVNPGESLSTIFKRHLGGCAGEGPPLAARVDQRVVALETRVDYPCKLAPVFISDREGMAVHRRSACLLLYEAAKELYPGAKVVVGQSLAGGYYFDMQDGPEPLADSLPIIEARMRQICAEKRPFSKTRTSGEEACRRFGRDGYPDKVKLLNTTRQSEVFLIGCGVFTDIWHGPFVQHAGYVGQFSLLPLPPGFVLQFPGPDGLFASADDAPDRSLFQIHMETKAWNRILGVTNVGALNEACLSGDIGEVIKIAEGFQEKKIAGFADEISARRDRVRLVLIAGPTSSGKTTFSKRLMVQLRVNGLHPVTLGMDNYFLDKARTPLGEDGRPDLESLGAVDTRLFNEQLEALLSGRAVETPVYDFPAGKRAARGVPMRLGEDDILIVEGIHGLNPELTESIPADRKLKIYISALTQLSLDDHNRIMTTDVRLIRRIVRDRAFRGHSAARSLAMWPSVLRGERRNIFPFQGEADLVFNSSLVYEPAVLRPYAERYLLEVPMDDAESGHAQRLLDFIRMFVPVFPDEIPYTSILREFIGGSSFSY